MTFVRDETTRQADEHLDDFRWLQPWTAKADTQLDIWHEPWWSTSNYGESLHLEHHVAQIVQRELGSSPEELWKCRRKLYILVNRIQKYGPAKELVSVGCIATPVPKLSVLKAKVERALKNYDRTKGRDEDGRVVCRLRKPVVDGISWVALLDEYQDVRPAIIGDEAYEPDALLSGIYGLQVRINHTIESEHAWYRRTDVIICAFRFRWRPTDHPGQPWKRRIFKSGLSSRAVSLSDSIWLQTLSGMLDEHSYSKENHSEALDSWKSECAKELEERKTNQSTRSTKTLSDTDKSEGSHWRFWKSRKSKRMNVERSPRPPPEPKRKRTSVVQAFDAASERLSIFGSMSSSDVWNPRESITLASLLSGATGLGLSDRTDTGQSSIVGGAGPAGGGEG